MFFLPDKTFPQVRIGSVTQVVTQPSDLSKRKYNVKIHYNVCESLHIEKIQAQKCENDVFAVLTTQVSVLLGGNDNDSDKGAWPRKILNHQGPFCLIQN